MWDGISALLIGGRDNVERVVGMRNVDDRTQTKHKTQTINNRRTNTINLNHIHTEHAAQNSHKHAQTIHHRHHPTHLIIGVQLVLDLLAEDGQQNRPALAHVKQARVDQILDALALRLYEATGRNALDHLDDKFAAKHEYLFNSCTNFIPIITVLIRVRNT